jgi:uncharacterized repeat protein (TIGR02543 family)
MKSKGYRFFIILGLCAALSQIEIFAQDSRRGNEDKPLVVATGALSGRVYESDGTTPIAYPDIKIYDSSWSLVKNAYGNSSGYYIAEYLGSGDYYVHARHNNYFDEFYNNSPTETGASLVTVSVEDTTESINFTLSKKGSISGTVTEEGTGSPIAKTMVNVYNLSWESVGGAQTNASGEYVVQGLSDGSYYLKSTGYIVGEGEFFVPEYYNNSPIQGGAASVSVTAPNTTGEIHFVMTRGFHVYIDVIPDWGGTYEISSQKLVYAPGDVVTITAHGVNDYHFDHWSGDASGADSVTQVTMNSDQYVNAHFSPNQSSVFNLTVNVEPEGAGWYQLDPNQTEYDSGAVVNIEMYPNTGWQFSHWSGDLEGDANPREIIMNSSKIVNAHFIEPVPKYNLNLSVNPPEAGWITKDPEQPQYDSSAVVELTAHPESGWVFNHWSGDHDGGENPSTVVMDFDKYITAIFGHQLETFVHPEGIGEISKDPAKEVYEHNEVVELTAHAPEGYVFSYWDGSVYGTENPISVTMDSNKEAIAKFMSTEAILTMRVFPEEGGTTEPDPGEHTYTTGDTVYISAIPAEGYQFKKWECTVGDYYSPNTYVVMNGDQTVDCIFEPVSDEVTLELKVYPTEGGWTNPEPGVHTYEYGATVEIAALPETGYHFKRWEGDVVDQYSQNTTITLNGNKTVWAKFESNSGEVNLNMLVTPENGGTTDPEPGTHWCVKDDTVDIKAIPAPGYKFKRWNCVVGDHYSPETYVVMIGNETITAVFEPIVTTFWLTVNVDPEDGGVTNPSAGYYLYNQGQVVDLTAEPEEGYQFEKWTGDVADPDSSHTTVAMCSNQTVTAHFKRIQYTLTMKVNPKSGGTTEPEIGQHNYEVGDTVQIIAVPSEGYHFIGWDGDVENEEDDTTSVVMNQDRTVWAKFQANTCLLTIHANPEEGGNTEPELGQYTYVKGDTVDVSAIPEEGYAFVKWIGDVLDSTSQNTRIVMTGDKKIWAVFESLMVTLTIKSDPDHGGKTEPETGNHKYITGDTVDVSAIPEAGYEFVEWEGGVVDPHSQSTEVIVNESKTVIAVFSQLDLIWPELKNCFPVPQATAVPKNTKIKFKVWDAQTGVNLASLRSWVNEQLIIEEGADQTGGSVEICPNSKGYKVTYRPSEQFEEGSTVTVRAQFSDLASPPNSCDSTYTFEIGVSKADTSAAQEIGQEGGTVQDSTNGVEIQIPENALEDTVEITISEVEEPPPLPEGVTGLAMTYHFGPDGLQFNSAVVIQIPYTNDDLEKAGVDNPEDLRLFYFHTSTGSWVELDVDSVDTIQMILYFHVEEFCYFTFVVEGEPSTDVTQLEADLPRTFGLSQNYPNPFNPETHVTFDIAEPSHVKITVYNISGRLIRMLTDERKTPGHYEVIWDGRDSSGNLVSTGLYCYVMKAGDRIFVKKMSFMK